MIECGPKIARRGDSFWLGGSTRFSALLLCHRKVRWHHGRVHAASIYTTDRGHPLSKGSPEFTNWMGWPLFHISSKGRELLPQGFAEFLNSIAAAAG